MSKFSTQAIMETIEGIMARRAQGFDDAALAKIREICKLLAMMDAAETKLADLLEQYR